MNRHSLFDEVRRIVSRADLQRRDLTPTEASHASTLLDIAEQLPASPPVQRNPTMKLDLRNMRKLPALMAELVAEAEAQRVRREGLIAQLAQERARFETADAGLAGEIGPLEAKAETLRAQLADIETKLGSLRMARASGEFVAKETEKRFKAELRNDVEHELREFLSELDELRAEISSNATGRRAFVLGSFRPDLPHQERCVGVIQRTLLAYRQAERLAVSEADFTGALARLRAGLVGEGIGFLVDA